MTSLTIFYYTSCMKNIENTLKTIYEKYINNSTGHLASYIPELTKANPNDFGLSIVTMEGETFNYGSTDSTFTLQSTSKPFVYAMALEELGREFVRSKVGVEPTGEAFNSIIELEKKTHRPYNPMINSGAIAISSMIKDKDSVKRDMRILNLFEEFTGRNLTIDENVFQSERNTAHRNRSIAHLLRHFNIIDADIEESLDLYFKQCSILVNTTDLAKMAATLASGGIQPLTKKVVIKNDIIKDVLSLMFTCGMYDTAGEWATNVGLPSKSGVSGGIICVVPGKMGIACYSPLIDDHGHSVRGALAINELVKLLNINLFSVSK